MLPALVLTAGLGTRLDPLTRILAKAAVPLAGRTLVERAIALLRAQGVTDLVLNLHHLPETITAVVGDGRALGVRVRYSWEPTLLGSAGGPRHALSLLDSDRFLIVNGDALFEANLAEMIRVHDQTGAAVTLALVPNPAPDRYNGVVLGDDDRVLEVVPRGARSGVNDPGTWHFVGIQVANRDVFAGVPPDTPAESLAGIYRDRMGQSLYGWRTSGRFVDVGTPRDYLEAAMAMGGDASGRTLIDRESDVDARARLTRTVVWKGARIAAGVELQDCVVAGGLTLPDGFRGRNAVIVPASLVRQGESAALEGDAARFPL